MSDDRIVVGAGRASKPSEATSDFATAWRVIGATSWLLIIVGGVDLGLALYPFRFGTPEWEFATASVLLDNLPLFTVGVMLQAASAAALGWKIRFRVLTWLMPLALLTVLAAITLYALALPLALGEVTEPGERLLLKKASTKTFVQAVCYSVLFAGVFIVARRRARP